MILPRFMSWGCQATFFMASSLALALISSSSDASPTNFSTTGEMIRWMYEEWLVLHDKSYTDPRERMHRFGVFKENLHLIDEHNRLKNITYRLGPNQFSDLTFEEFSAHYLYSYNGTLQRLNSPESDRYMYKEGEILPPVVDWIALGAVGPIKDQRRCSKFFF